MNGQIQFFIWPQQIAIKLMWSQISVSENATDYLIYYDADNSGSTLFFPTNGAIDQKHNSVIDALNFQAVWNTYYFFPVNFNS